MPTPPSDMIPPPAAGSGGEETHAEFRQRVAVAALALFAAQGFTETPVGQIAEAAGISRSAFFRQFRSKEDVIFADHDTLLEDAQAFLSLPQPDPWEAVCAVATTVFEHFVELGPLAAMRYKVVGEVPALRERELVTVFRYERLFVRYLRSSLPHVDPIRLVSFAAAVISANNYLLRSLLRGTAVDLAEHSAAMKEVRRIHGLHASPEDHHADLVVAVFPSTLTPGEAARHLERTLRNRH